MSTEEKLIEILKRFETPVMFGDIEIMQWALPTNEILTALVDHLIDEGVTIPVLCEDCDHLRHTEDGGTYCAITWSDVDNDDFCSYGRRKDDEQQNESTRDF